MSRSTGLVSRSGQGDVVVLRLEDPDRRNALSMAMLERLLEELEAAGRSRASVVRIEGEGSAFCAGIDLDVGREDPRRLGDLLELLSQAMRSIRVLPQVVVARVQGAAIAGGCALLSACDFSCGEPGTRLGYPVPRVGLSAAVSVPTLLGTIGPSRVRSLLLEASVLDGETAFRSGLLTHFADSLDRLDELVGELCGELAAKGPEAMRRTKAWLNELDGSIDDARHERALACSVSTTGTEEARALLESNWNRGGRG